MIFYLCGVVATVAVVVAFKISIVQGEGGGGLREQQFS